MFFNPTFAHGTTFSALFLTSLLPKQQKHCVIPFGVLQKMQIPVFSGECFRGIAANGVNQTKTSWTSIKTARAAFEYSKKFPFSYEASKQYLEEIIADNENPDNSHPPFHTTQHSAYWNKTLLKIQQVRAWNPAEFQEQLKPGLLHWIKREIDSFIQTGRKLVSSPQEFAEHIDRMQTIKDELEDEAFFVLSEEDRAQISKSFPIVFLLGKTKPDFELNGEFGIKKNLKLGKDICMIATHPDHMDELSDFLETQGLARKVRVISFAALALEKLAQSS